MLPDIQPTEARTAASNLLDALQSRSWSDFEASFHESATVFLSEDGSDIVPWREIRDGWRTVFATEIQGPRPLVRSFELSVEQQGTTAFVSFEEKSKAAQRRRAIVLELVDGEWLVQHLHVDRLPLQPVSQTADSRAPEPGTPDGPNQPWFVPALVLSLIAIACLGVTADRRSELQITCAVLAVFLGAVTIVHRELGTWFNGMTRAGSDVPLTSGGALSLAVGAAFLVT